MYTFPNPLARPSEAQDHHFISDYYLWKKCADDNLIQEIVKLGESLEQQSATIGTNEKDSTLSTNTRISTISWIHQTEQSKFFFDFLIDKIDRINYHHYGMNLLGMEAIQYTKYSTDGHYAYHRDLIVKNRSMRKLSFVLALTDKDEYSGGEFLLMPHGQNPEVMKFSKGDLIAFPSYVPHKVNPVTEGLRITAVAWALGPLFI